MRLDANLFVLPGASVREALEAITKNSRQMVLAADADGRLAGMVTDGDIRRAILRGVSLEARVADIMNPRPVTAPAATTRSEALALMQRRSIRHLPMVDGERRVVDLFVLDDLLRPAELRNRAVIMAGGAGERLRPLTDSVPKPLLRVGGKPLLEILVERLRGAGVRHFTITVRYKSEMVEAHFGDGTRFGVRIDYVREREPLGTAGSLTRLAGPLLDPFLLVNGDILTKCDFRALLEFHERAGAAMTVGTVPHAVEVPYGVLEVDSGRLTAISEKPRLDFLVNSGIYVISPDVIASIPRDRVFDVTDLISVLVAGGRTVAAAPIREYWLDVGRHGDFQRADRDVAEGLLD